MGLGLGSNELLPHACGSQHPFICSPHTYGSQLPPMGPTPHIRISPALMGPTPLVTHPTLTFGPQPYISQLPRTLPPTQPHAVPPALLSCHLCGLLWGREQLLLGPTTGMRQTWMHYGARGVVIGSVVQLWGGLGVYGVVVGSMR